MLLHENNKFDVVLFERDVSYGLTHEEVELLMKHINDDEMFPISVSTKYTSAFAIGFVGIKALEQIEYRIHSLCEYIDNIISDINMENPDCVYSYMGLTILLTRNFPKVI